MKVLIDIDEDYFNIIKQDVEHGMDYRPCVIIAKGMTYSKAHWLVDERPESNREIICSRCEQTIFKYHKLDFDYKPNYCPNCGAYMWEDAE